VVTGTAEYEHYFGGGPWGAAAFVDTGSAFDNSIDLHTGIGFGVHAGARRSGRCAWMSPTASQPVQFQLYLNVGAEFEHARHA
jgi:translocation and assembly module TamA